MKQLIYNFTAWVNECDPKTLKNMLDSFVDKSDYTVINKTEHYFEPVGYTCLWLLAESHLALHTFPEDNKTYIELSSCNFEKNEHFKSLFTQWQTSAKK